MAQPDPRHSECVTRKQLIDEELRRAGWTPTAYKTSMALSSVDRVALEEYPTSNGPADYVLVADGRILAAVEAKKLSIGPGNVLVQAARYARGLTQADLAFGEYGVPFLYATNGQVLRFHDVREPLNLSREVARFYTPDALKELLGRDRDHDLGVLAALPNDNARLRPYQRDANTAIEAAIAARKHAMLVAMATGTGKTFTMVNEVYRLMKSGVAKRVLFLVDRRALAAQAVKAFAAFDAEAGMKFDQIYEVYSQRFQRDDVEEKFNPKVLLPEQIEIVRRVKVMFALADRLNARHDTAKSHVDKLTQAVLAKAFRGELVPTEAQLAKAQGRSYETAEEQLARVRGVEASRSLKTPKTRAKKAARARSVSG